MDTIIASEASLGHYHLKRKQKIPAEETLPYILSKEEIKLADNEQRQSYYLKVISIQEKYFFRTTSFNLHDWKEVAIDDNN